MSRIKRKQIDLTLSAGPTDGTYGTKNSPGLLNTDTMENAFDKMTFLLDKLAPQQPPVLSSTTLVFTNTPAFTSGFVSGASTATPVTNITYATRPSFVSPRAPSAPVGGEILAPIPGLFQDGSFGYVGIQGDSNEIDIAGTQGSSLLAPVTAAPGSPTPTATSVTTNNGRTISLDINQDYWLNIPGRGGFWRGIATTFQDKTQLPSGDESQFTAQYSLSPNGVNVSSSRTFKYRVESDILPLVNSVAFDASSAYTHSGTAISGVPVLTASDTLNLRVDMSNVSRFYYKAFPLDITSTSLVESAKWAWPTIPLANAQQNGSSAIQHTLKPKSGIYVENASVTATATDALNRVATAGFNSTKVRIDTLSNVLVDARRLVLMNTTSSTPVFERLFNTPYSHATQLTSGVYANELMLEGGNYVYPSKNYSGYYPLVTPTGAANVTRNYTGLTGMRMATWRVGSIANANSITISTPGLSQLIGDVSFRVYVIVGNVTTNTWYTPWLDASKSYNATNAEQTALNNTSSSYDGSAAMDQASSPTTRSVFISSAQVQAAASAFVYVRICWDQTKSINLFGPPTLTGTTGGTFNAAA